MARRAWHKKDATTYRPIIDWVVNDLNLWDIDITYWFKAYKTLGGRATEKRNGFVVKVSTNESDEYIRFTIAHELRHVWQYKHKKLTHRWDGTEWRRIWDNVEYLNSHTNKLFRNSPAAYKLQPWEKDANDYANRVLPDLKLIPTRS